ncbi:hypothetical protein [Streptomyces justiciae]|uniref:hypothetical protein n=1 Tax=Streptomyces justiciae TaxID=2780140 RepID=UPI002118D8BD|nr:hypothetical protein [Streptomyces justiciae]MCW8379770.1 hypothetical protein [Streptomyces justiciae]
MTSNHRAHPIADARTESSPPLMSATSPDVHVRFDTHPAHPSAVTAHLTGTLPNSAHALLVGRGFESLDEHTMVPVRIDHEEPYWAHQELAGQGITPRLQEAIQEEWT